MTVETQIGGEPIVKSGPYNGDGVTTNLDYDFQVQANTEILVTRQNADLTEDVLVLTTDYTVTGVGNDAGGQIVLVDPATDFVTGSKIVLTYDGNYNQSVDYSNQGAIQLSLLEASLDKIVMHLRTLKEQADRSVKVDSFGAVDIDTLTANINALAAIEATISNVSSISAEIVAVDADAMDIGTVASNIASINTIVLNLADILAVAGIDADITTVAGDSADIATVAANIANINAAVADLPSLAAKVSKTGDTMSGNLAMGGNTVTGLAAGAATGDAARYDELILKASKAGDTFTGPMVFEDEIKITPEAVTYAASFNIDMADSSVKEFTTSATAATATLTNIAAHQQVECRITCGSGSASLAWSGVTKWAGGAAPVLSQNVGDVDVIVLSVQSDGTTVLGEHIAVYS